MWKSFALDILILKFHKTVMQQNSAILLQRIKTYGTN